MNETAFILNTATRNSLVIMDEVGRGTGTNDGLSIAWAVSEELLNRIGCRTLFATHFHELSLLSHPHLANRSMEVLDNDGKIVFLRKLVEGPAAESYGIHVAKLAGITEHILRRAAQIMELLKVRDVDLSKTFHSGVSSQKNESILVNHEDNTVNVNEIIIHNLPVSEIVSYIEKILKDTDLEKITPLEALNMLTQIKKLYFVQDMMLEKERRPGKQIKTVDTSLPTLFD
jgi:DNA mismatch repair protein MutS